MERLIVTTNTLADARFLASFLKEMKTVKSVRLERVEQTASEKLDESYNWTNPSRPATEEEFEQMIAEAKAEYKSGKILTAKEAEESTKQSIKEWKNKKSR